MTNKSKFIETDADTESFERRLKRISKQIDEIGEKWGTFYDDIYIPTVLELLETEFNFYKSFQNVIHKDNGTIFEIDMLAESDTAFYLVEIKSHLKSSAIEQLKIAIQNFIKVEERAKDKPKYGIIVAAYYSEEAKQEVLNAGFYFISIIDEIAKLAVPTGFVPKEW